MNLLQTNRSRPFISNRSSAFLNDLDVSTLANLVLLIYKAYLAKSPGEKFTAWKLVVIVLKLKAVMELSPLPLVGGVIESVGESWFAEGVSTFSGGFYYPTRLRTPCSVDLPICMLSLLGFH